MQLIQEYLVRVSGNLCIDLWKTPTNKELVVVHRWQNPLDQEEQVDFIAQSTEIERFQISITHDDPYEETRNKTKTVIRRDQLHLHITTWGEWDLSRKLSECRILLQNSLSLTFPCPVGDRVEVTTYRG